MQNVWDVIWASFVIFALFAYLIVLFSIVGDLFRDRDLNGGFKALWILFLIFLPYITALVYLIARGKGMAERQYAYANAAREATDSYIREAAGTGPAGEIAQAKVLLDAGTITAEEYDKLKSKALA
jgi:hypothetical protein